MPRVDLKQLLDLQRGFKADALNQTLLALQDDGTKITAFSGTEGKAGTMLAADFEFVCGNDLLFEKIRRLLEGRVPVRGIRIIINGKPDPIDFQVNVKVGFDQPFAR